MDRHATTANAQNSVQNASAPTVTASAASSTVYTGLTPNRSAARPAGRLARTPASPATVSTTPTRVAPKPSVRVKKSAETVR